MFGRYFGSLSRPEMESGTAIPQQGMVMQPFVMPMMFYCAPAGLGNLPQEAFTYSTSHEKPAPEEAPEEAIEKPHCESDDEVYYHLALAYNNAGEWRAIEDSLFIRATKLSTIEQCYLEKNEGVYVPWGTVATDCEGVLRKFPLGFVHISLEQMQACTVAKGKPVTRTRGLKVALRELRTYPNLIGFVCFDDGRKCFLEADRKENNKKETKHRLEDELLLAIVHCKQAQAQITFW